MELKIGLYRIQIVRLRAKLNFNLKIVALKKELI